MEKKPLISNKLYHEINPTRVNGTLRRWKVKSHVHQTFLGNIRKPSIRHRTYQIIGMTSIEKNDIIAIISYPSNRSYGNATTIGNKNASHPLVILALSSVILILKNTLLCDKMFANHTENKYQTSSHQ